MIASGHLALYRDGLADSIRRKLAVSEEARTRLDGQLQNLEVEQALLTEALVRAETLGVRIGMCPRCLIWTGRDVPLSPVPVPEGGDAEVEYFACSVGCGFDNLP
jgi:hypothetical protein